MKAAFYIHIPFCLKKCSYCDFYSIQAEQALIERFLDALKIEIEFYAEHPIFSQAEFQTLYFGGGTPSLLSTKQIDELIQYIQNFFRFREAFEFTIEVNPETVNQKILQEFYLIGVNRLSIGVQSFSDHELSILDRIHNSIQAKKSIEWANQAGFDNINIDLIFAIPGQSQFDWIDNLRQAIAFKPKHLSIYCLTIEPGTLLEHQILSVQLKKVDEETEREMYLTAIEIISQNGFKQYEISNFALSGSECQHNRMYWNQSPYLGIGPSAHSFWQFHRQWNIDSIDLYLESIKIGRKPIADHEELSQNQQMLEFLYLNLRTADGIDIQHFDDQFQLSFKEKFGGVLEKISSYPDDKLIHCQNNKLRLTPTGFVLFDEICQYFGDEI